MLLLLAALACSTEPVAPPAPAAPPAPQPVAPDAPPAGRIGGEPILADPVVLGGIDAAAVRAGLDARRGQIDACWQAAAAEQPGLSGKVLVRFAIDEAGRVASARVQSTSLRHDGAEACILDQVGQASFAALEVGQKALVTWPFVFPPTS